MIEEQNLLYREPRSSYVIDRIGDMLVPIIVLFFVQFALVFLILAPIIPELSRLETAQIVALLSVMVAVSVILAWILYEFTSIVRFRERFEIHRDRIRLPYPRTKSLSKTWRSHRGLIIVQAISKATLKLEEKRMPLSSSPVLWWECTLELKDGEIVTFSRSGPGCYDMRALEAVKIFVRIVMGDELIQTGR